MARYYFHLRAETKILRDSIGSECHDLAAAHARAHAVATDLMRNAQSNTRLWSLRVVDEQGEALFDVFFSDIAVEVTGARPYDAHEVTANTCRRLVELSDAVHAARNTRADSQILLARARGKPQLVYDSAEGAKARRHRA